jgi:hypothetical protein
LWLEISVLNPQNTPLTRTDCKGIDFLLFPEKLIKNSGRKPALKLIGLVFYQNPPKIDLALIKKERPQIAPRPASKELKDNFRTQK